METKILTDISPENIKELPACESCGEKFVCGAKQNGCWCMDLKLDDTAREILKSKFKDCLCKNCLEKFNSMEV